ncbi:MAG: glycosyltransferase [Vicinamibacterales bacterium]
MTASPAPPRSGITGDSCRMAIVHDWLTGMRGGEKVLDLLCRRYPHADVFTMVHVPGSVSPAIERHHPVRSPVGHLPGVGRYYRHCLPLFPAAVEHFDLDGYELVISTSHCAVKSAIVPRTARHLCYCFTPMRYAWDQFEAYFGEARLGLMSRAMKATLGHLARWDARTSTRPDRYLSISQYVADRIGRYYNRRSVIVYPPVDTAFFTPGSDAPEPFALVVSALVPYKRVDLAIQACESAGVPLFVVGQGPERSRLEQLGGRTTTFLGPLPDDDVRSWYRRTAAVLLPGEEDFGLVPVEAQACGRPVVALARGGALETVVHDVTGTLVTEPTVTAFSTAIRDTVGRRYDAGRIRRHAETFSSDSFLTRFGQQVDDLLQAPAEAVRW